jgi:hypothetical protein
MHIRVYLTCPTVTKKEDIRGKVFNESSGKATTVIVWLVAPKDDQQVESETNSHQLKMW